MWARRSSKTVNKNTIPLKRSLLKFPLKWQKTIIHCKKLTGFCLRSTNFLKWIKRFCLNRQFYIKSKPICLKIKVASCGNSDRNRVLFYWNIDYSSTCQVQMCIHGSNKLQWKHSALLTLSLSPPLLTCFSSQCQYTFQSHKNNQLRGSYHGAMGSIEVYIQFGWACWNLS